MQRPNKPVFTVHVNEGFTTPVEPSLPDFVDASLLLDEDWDEDLSYSTSARDQFAPVAVISSLVDNK